VNSTCGDCTTVTERRGEVSIHGVRQGNPERSARQHEFCRRSCLFPILVRTTIYEARMGGRRQGRLQEESPTSSRAICSWPNIKATGEEAGRDGHHTGVSAVDHKANCPLRMR